MKKRILAIAAVTALLVSLLSCPALADGVQPGDRFRFGRFEQDLFTVNGPDPIVWRVLDTDDAAGLVLAVSEMGLYTMAYHHDNNQTAWGDTDVRAWLNTAFAGSFSEDELSQVAVTTVSGSEDRFFLLDSDQITRYLREPYLCYATPRALKEKKPGAFVNEETGGSSWLVRTDTAKKRIAWVGGAGALYSPTGKRGVNYLKSNDNAVRPAMWIRKEACTDIVTDFTVPLYARTNQRLSTRSGPSTGFSGLADYFDEGGEVVRVLSRANDGTIWWLEIEFEYNGMLVRCYTGLKRIDIAISRVPDDRAGFLYNATVAQDGTAYYGPGTNYKHMPPKLTPAAGTAGCVVKEENGWCCFEYPGEGRETYRVWLPADVFSAG